MYFKQLIKNRQEKSSQGFTLIEVLIALCIFSIGILAVATMQISAINGNSSARRRTEAVTLAMDRMERIISQDYAGIVAGGPETQNNYNITWMVMPQPGYKEVDLTVVWSDRGTQRTTTLNYIKADI